MNMVCYMQNLSFNPYFLLNGKETQHEVPCRIIKCFVMWDKNTSLLNGWSSTHKSYIAEIIWATVLQLIINKIRTAMIGFVHLRPLRITSQYCMLTVILKYGFHTQKAKH